MFVGGGRMLMTLLAVFMSGDGVFFGLFVLTKIVMMRCLSMMVGGSVVMRGGLMMMLARRMLSHRVSFLFRFLFFADRSTCRKGVTQLSWRSDDGLFRMWFRFLPSMTPIHIS
jgi:hypothetical protein